VVLLTFRVLLVEPLRFVEWDVERRCASGCCDCDTAPEWFWIRTPWRAPCPCAANRRAAILSLEHLNMMLIMLPVLHTTSDGTRTVFMRLLVLLGFVRVQGGFTQDLRALSWGGLWRPLSRTASRALRVLAGAVDM